MSKLSKNLLKYGITTAIGLIMAVVYIFSRDYGGRGFWSWPLMNKALIICDAFTIPAVMFLGIGSLVWVSAQGALDGVSFTLKHGIWSLLPGRRKKHLRYYDYVQQKRANRPQGFGFLFVVGIAFLAIALIFMAVYYGNRRL